MTLKPNNYSFESIFRAAKTGALGVLLMLGGINTSLNAQELSYEAIEVSKGLYMLTGAGGFTGGNVGLSVGDDGIAMIDNGLSSTIEILKAKVASISDKPVDYLISTHVHGDHTGNNAVYGKDGTRIITHENLRANLIAKGISDGDKKVAAPKESLPIITFSDRMTLHINGDAAKIIHFNNAHTDGDAVIHFANANVIHAGDIMFNGRFPYIDKDNGGSLKGVIAALKGIASMSNEDTKIIPGHGPLAAKDDVEKTLIMLEDAKAMVAKLINDGKSNKEIFDANPLSKYQSYHWGFITTEKMTQQLIDNLR